MQDIIVVGASAGGVEALQTVVAGFAADLKAAVFVVLHIGNGLHGRSHLPEILMRAGPLPVSHPETAEEFCQGHIYIAPPDCHMTLGLGHLHVFRGPKENRSRPAINPLFRSAAEVYGSRVTGVILTGMLDDGVAGLAEIKRRGGIAIVQDPATALFPSMPAHALQQIDADYIVTVPEVAELVSKLATVERVATEREEPMEKTLLHLTCPECRGPLWEKRQGRIVEYRCRVGHAYSALSLAREHEETVERTLWSAAVAIEEAVEIAEQLTPELGDGAEEDILKKRAQLKSIQKMLENTEPKG
ncbi:MAG TPA: chemotaxis protein CheB [Candidatus Sulfopaludibacter sp.]|jgi:two-component system chemotaxis response regulator CheB|nr:chemotaxis protein CheB [Candidatus Sulfopaludibacter sp.]